MQAFYRALYHIQGKPFSVRRTDIVAVGLGQRPADEQPENPRADMVMEDSTVITVRDLGNVPVDESYEDALAQWDGDFGV